MDCVKHIFISFNSNICEVVAVMTLNVNCTKLYFNLKTPFHPSQLSWMMKMAGAF